MRTFSAALAGVAAAVVTAAGVVVAAPPASAHAGLESADPTDGAVLRTSPATLNLTFTETLDRDRVQLALTRGGERVPQSGAVTTRDGSVAIAVTGTLDAGRYTLAYRVVSGDDHPVTGTIRFRVTASARSRATGATPGSTTPTTAAAASDAATSSSGVAPAPSASVVADEQSDGTSDGSSSTPLVIGIVAVLLVAGAGLIGWRRRRAGAP